MILKQPLEPMRTLIIPDLHHRTDNADHWLATQSYDRVVFLGDYFDNFGDTAGDAAKTARWLRDRMDSTEDIFLIGNHDIPYMFPDDPQFDCPGFTRPKARAIREILEEKHWRRLKLAHAEQGWLMSHAGFHPSWMDEPSVERILERCEMAMQHAKRRVVDPFFGAGYERGGNQPDGGPLWMDFDNLVPIPKINQIVGHTPGGAVREKIRRGSKNYCLDVKNASVAAILSDKKLNIIERE
jgi:hypothetical protein